MPFDLDAVLVPTDCAVLLVDLQRALMGDLSSDTR
jgi:hypothetical protein